MNLLNKRLEKLLIVTNKKFYGVSKWRSTKSKMKGISLNQKIDSIVNKKALTISDQLSENEAYDKINSKILVLPVLNIKNEIKGYYFLKIKINYLAINYPKVHMIRFGMGYVGLTLGATISNLGFNVIHFDKNKIIKNLVANHLFLKRFRKIY